MVNLLSAGTDDAARLIELLFDIKRADTLGKAPSCFDYVEDIERMRLQVRALLGAGEAYSLKTLALTGRDLIAAGVAPGPEIGARLGSALDAVIDGKVANETAALLDYLRLR